MSTSRLLFIAAITIGLLAIALGSVEAALEAAAVIAGVWLIIWMLSWWLKRRLPMLHVRWGWIIIFGATAAVWPVLGWFALQEMRADHVGRFAVISMAGGALFMVGLSIVQVWLVQLVLRTR